MSVTTGDSIKMEKPEWLSQMEAVLEVLNEGVIVANERLQILFANTRFLEMTGISQEELIYFDPSQFYSSRMGFSEPADGCLIPYRAQQI